MISQRKSPDRGAADRPALFESGSAEIPEKFMSAIIYVSHIDISWVQCYKTASHDEILNRFDRGDVPNGVRKPCTSGEGRELSTVRLSSGISANILDFRLPQKHVLGPCWRGNRPQGWHR